MAATTGAHGIDAIAAAVAEAVDDGRLPAGLDVVYETRRLLLLAAGLGLYTRVTEPDESPIPVDVVGIRFGGRDGNRARAQGVWDAVADPLVASLLDRGDVPRVNELLRTWRTNDQPLPDGLPADLRDFIVEARQLPSWADMDQLSTAVEFNKKRGTYLGLQYGLGSGMMSTVIPKEAGAVYHSRGGTDMKSRISRTAKLGYDIGSPDAYLPGGEMIVTCVKTRLLDPVLGPTPEGLALADILLDMASDADQGLLSRRMLEWFTRYMLGDEIAGWLRIPRHRGSTNRSDTAGRRSWPWRRAGYVFRSLPSCTGPSTNCCASGPCSSCPRVSRSPSRSRRGTASTTRADA